MASIEQRVDMIEQSVLEDAQQRSEVIRKQADEYRQKEIDKIENQILGELYGKIQAEVSRIHSATTTDISHHEAQLRQKLLHRREELTEAIFTEVRQKLLESASTDLYREQLLKTAQELAQTFPTAGSSVAVSTRDAQLLPQLQVLFGQDCKVETTDEIRLGGIRLSNAEAGVYVDETLDTKLEEQRPWFYSHSGLTLG